MRCVACRSTGFTEDELLAHEKSTGHKRPADRASWATQEDFPSSAISRIPKDELISALKDLGLSFDVVDGKIVPHAPKGGL